MLKIINLFSKLFIGCVNIVNNTLLNGTGGIDFETTFRRVG